MVKEGLSRMSARLCFQLLSFSPQQICWLQTRIESAGFRNSARQQIINKSSPHPLEANARIRRSINERFLFAEVCLAVFVPLSWSPPWRGEGTARGSSERTT